MSRTFVFLVAALFVLFIHTDRVGAANFTCLDGDETYYSEQDIFWIDGLPTDRRYCRIAVMSGTIVSDDLRAFKEFLRTEPYVRYLRAHSPGGSVEAAIEIGRLIRSRFISVWTADHDTDADRAKCRSIEFAREALQHELLPLEDLPLRPLVTDDEIRLDEQRSKARNKAIRSLKIEPDRLKRFQDTCRTDTDCRIGARCCISACVLVLAGSINWNIRNLGLHRPSLRDLTPRSYEDVSALLSNAQQRIQSYLKDMDVPQRVFEAMMQVPPDDVQLLDRKSAWSLFFGVSNNQEALDIYKKRRDAFFPRSIYDWIARECPEMPILKNADSTAHFQARTQRDICMSDVMDKEFLRRVSKQIQ